MHGNEKNLSNERIRFRRIVRHGKPHVPRKKKTLEIQENRRKVKKIPGFGTAEVDDGKRNVRGRKSKGFVPCDENERSRSSAGMERRGNSRKSIRKENDLQPQNERRGSLVSCWKISRRRLVEKTNEKRGIERRIRRNSDSLQQGRNGRLHKKTERFVQMHDCERKNRDESYIFERRTRNVHEAVRNRGEEQGASRIRVRPAGRIREKTD